MEKECNEKCNGNCKCKNNCKENNIVEENHNPEEFRLIIYKPKFHVRVWRFIRNIFKKEEYYI